MKIIDGDARMECLRERREVIDAMWAAGPLHPIRWLRLLRRSYRLDRQYAAIMKGIEGETP